MANIYWEEEQLGEYREIDTQIDNCPSCGNNLVYSAEKKKISCDQCGYSEETGSENDKIIENILKKAIEDLKEFQPEYYDQYGYHCDNCGANLIIESDKVNILCGFCGSDRINKTALETNFISPIGIIPFYVSRSEAETQFVRWIKQGWFHPSKLKSQSTINNLHGIYIPFWTFDAKTQSQWNGQAGYYHYSTRMVRVNGKMQSQRVRNIRWKYRSGRLDHFFDDITIAASNKLDHGIVNRILPYRLDEAVNFDPRLLLGWETEIYNIELDKAYQLADEVMDYKLRHMCSAQLGGDTQRNLRVMSTKSGQTFKLLVLPLWISTYKYNNKIYHFMINGQTGRVYGKKPLSWVKIGFLILLFILLIAAIFLLRESGVLQ